MNHFLIVWKHTQFHRILHEVLHPNHFPPSGLYGSGRRGRSSYKRVCYVGRAHCHGQLLLSPSSRVSRLFCKCSTASRILPELSFFTPDTLQKKIYPKNGTGAMSQVIRSWPIRSINTFLSIVGVGECLLLWVCRHMTCWRLTHRYAIFSWAHGSLSALADRIKIARNAVGDDINLSIQWVLNCGGGKMFHVPSYHNNCL